MFDAMFQILVSLVAEIVFIGFAACILFRTRNKISIAPLFIFVGTNQYLGTVLASSIYLHIGDGVVVSPGSVVLFSSYLFVILMVYLRTDIPTTRGLILGIVAANVTIAVLLWFTKSQMTSLELNNLINVPVELFSISPRFFIFGTFMLVFDSLLVIVIHDFLAARTPVLGQPVRIALALVLILLIDAIAFTMILAYGEDYFFDILKGQVIGKTSAGVLYALILLIYLSFVEPEKSPRSSPSISEIFSIFTHRERYYQVKEKLEVAEAANLAKSRFLTNMSHELRTPLNAIIGFTMVVHKRSQPESEEQLFLSRVLENGKHLLALINGLLDLSKIEAGNYDLQLSEIDLNQVITETMDQLEGQNISKGLSMRTEVPDMPVIYTTDPVRFKQVLINLIGNALKFTTQGEVVARLQADPDTGRPVRVDIFDTGKGVASSDLEAIFLPFYHDESAVEEETDTGMGLGLAIARALCVQMGIELGVSSTVGEGSNFFLKFSQNDPRPA